MAPTPCPAAWLPRWGRPLTCSRPSRRAMKGPQPREVSLGPSVLLCQDKALLQCFVHPRVTQAIIDNGDALCTPPKVDGRPG